MIRDGVKNFLPNVSCVFKLFYNSIDLLLLRCGDKTTLAISCLRYVAQEFQAAALQHVWLIGTAQKKIIGPVKILRRYHR